MSSMTVDFSRRFPWATVLSVVIHGSVVAGILYTSMHQVIELPSPAQPNRDWETDRKSTRLNSSHLKLSRMPSSA